MDQAYYQFYKEMLLAELVPALGCTEPIAIAYAAAAAAHELGEKPQTMVIACSPNIVKNVKSVIVPNSGGLKGIEAAAALGAFGGDHRKKLEVLTGVTDEERAQAKSFVSEGRAKVELLPGDEVLHIKLTANASGHSVTVDLEGSHTNIVSIVKNGQVVFKKSPEESLPGPADALKNPAMNIDSILTFARTTALDDLKIMLDRQIEFNTKISDEGLNHPYGAQVGQVLMQSGSDVQTKAKARAAAASDARMSGSDLPVVINSGSGNQGIAVSLPVIEYAQNLGSSAEDLYRALLMSNLVALYQKSYIGKLSAYCGAISAACGSGAGITYLKGGSDDRIKATITNTLAIASGIVCDGAKPSCAAKIATAVDSAILGHNMAMSDHAFAAGDGIVKGEVDQTVSMVGRLATQGMKTTDQEILSIMLDDSGKGK